MNIHCTIDGPVPEKYFVIVAHNGRIKQSAESKEWEHKAKEQIKHFRGWVSKDDIEYGEHTPLRVQIDIYTPHKTTLIKQIKAIDDAMTGAGIYVDDCSVVDLVAERHYSEKEYLEIDIRPAQHRYIKVPDGKPVAFTKQIQVVQNTAWEDGHPLNTTAHNDDKEWFEYLRQVFDEQQEELIEGEFKMFIEIGQDQLKTRTPLSVRLGQDTFPIKSPDVDNCTYSILSALAKYHFGSPKDLKKLHVYKTYFDDYKTRNKVWLRNIKERTNNETNIIK